MRSGKPSPAASRRRDWRRLPRLPLPGWWKYDMRRHHDPRVVPERVWIRVGSVSNTSSTASASWPLASAARRSASTRCPPRPALITLAPRGRRSNVARPRMPRVATVNGIRQTRISGPGQEGVEGVRAVRNWRRQAIAWAIGSSRRRRGPPALLPRRSPVHPGRRSGDRGHSAAPAGARHGPAGWQHCPI